MKTQIIKSLDEFIQELDNDGDVQDLQLIANYIMKDETDLAYKHFRHLDTYVRDIIPRDVYDYICVNRCGLGKTKNITLTVKTNDGNVLYTNGVQFPEDASNMEIGSTLYSIEERCK
jgi:hypothetical protein